MKPQLHGSLVGSYAVVMSEEVDVVSMGGGGGMGDVAAEVAVGTNVVDVWGVPIVDVSTPALSLELPASPPTSTTGPQPMGQSSASPAAGRTMIKGSRVNMLGSWGLVA